MNIYNAVVFLSSFMPVWALLLARIKLTGRRWFFFTEVNLMASAILSYLYFSHWRWARWAHIVWFMYAVEVAMLLLLFTRKFGHDFFGRNLGLSLLIVYVLSEAHEWIGFVFADYLHLYQDLYVVVAGGVPLYQRILSNIYVILSFYLAIKMANIKWNWKIASLFSLTMLIPLPFLLFQGWHGLHIWKRFIMFLLWAAIFYVYARPMIWSGIGGKSVEAKV